MSPDEWDSIQEVATKGNILITKDSETSGYNHGHAAIVHTDCYSTVEILGLGYLSKEYNIDRWEGYTMVKLVYPAAASLSTRQAAADYSYSRYRNWNYAALPSVTSDSYLNCATLVWRSYNDAGVVLGKTGNSATPKSLLQGGGNITCKAVANWQFGTEW